MRLTGYPVFFLMVSRLKKSGGLNNPIINNNKQKNFNDGSYPPSKVPDILQ